MLNRTKRETTMRNIINDIYLDKDLSPILGFKGGTACYFFYKLPRFSTDLDFNLLNLNKTKIVWQKMFNILKEHGEVTDKHIKQNTIFFLLSHTKGRTAIKIEISTRKIEEISSYNLEEFYGTSILVMKKEDIFANKLIALTKRYEATPRDLFDIHFFFKNNWDINEKIIKKVTGEGLLNYLSKLLKTINKNFKGKNILTGFGELLENRSQKDFVKRKLANETINQIKFYIDSKERKI